jgi:hypothetical protein
MNLPVVLLIELQSRLSGTGFAESTMNTGMPFQDKGMQRAFFLSSAKRTVLFLTDPK